MIIIPYINKVSSDPYNLAGLFLLSSMVWWLRPKGTPTSLKPHSESVPDLNLEPEPPTPGALCAPSTWKKAECPGSCSAIPPARHPLNMLRPLCCQVVPRIPSPTCEDPPWPAGALSLWLASGKNVLGVCTRQHGQWWHLTIFKYVNITVVTSQDQMLSLPVGYNYLQNYSLFPPLLKHTQITESRWCIYTQHCITKRTSLLNF